MWVGGLPCGLFLIVSNKKSLLAVIKNLVYFIQSFLIVFFAGIQLLNERTYFF